ncbi:caspase family protein [Algoriphagus sp. D3-2-R+10]|uniref:caspase family protein n=1 Tax=Algoriphagus aurantiacus TaxID=3103948 RepID=UPI002B3D25F0|nr:caspase family protein [Algoriphagus sp. D3-2-R+10]MEB2777461.1 caspase family protein [Algoriphagus sp. D3-2-R+10]
MKFVISIGVNNVKGLPTLGAAASGAIEFDTWAKSQGYKTKIFTDLEDTQVSQNDIFNEINRIVEEKTCEMLIIFFSGHGILRSPNQEVWLLSNAKNNPNESINLTGSIDYARTTGIPYIVFISDACRILPAELQFTGNGSVIFPIYDDNNHECAIDVLYATRPGSPANEYNSLVNSEKFGLFTQSILEILNGKYPETIWPKLEGESNLLNFYDANSLIKDSKYKQLKNGEWVIDTVKMENPLKSIVKKKASDINITLYQNPDIRIQHQSPKPYLSRFDDSEAKNLILVTTKLLQNQKGVQNQKGLHHEDEEIFFETIDRGSGSGSKKSKKAFKESAFKKRMSSVEKIQMLEGNPRLLKNAEIIHKSNKKNIYKIHTGFTIVGTKIADVLVRGNNRRLSFENDRQEVRVDHNESKSALLILENGQSIPVAILEDFIGTVVFHKDRLLTINYTPCEGSYRYYEFEDNREKINLVRSYIASAANEGFDYQKAFENEFTETGHIKYDNPGSFLRMEKSLDPSLGLYAVYAYMQAGKIKDINSVFKYMNNESEDLIFDVAMLSGNLNLENVKLAPFCPMLSLGWAYRNRFEQYLLPDILEASKHLEPNLWTTFNENGTDLISKLFKQNKIR